MRFCKKLLHKPLHHHSGNLSAIASLILGFTVNSTVGINTSIAQGTGDPLVCASLFDDPDGDGIGQVPFTTDTCVVTEDTYSPPEYINSRTGEPAQLIRAFWDGNADLIGRDIVCQKFSSSGETGFFFEFRWFRFLAIPTGSTAGFYYSADTQAELTPDPTEVPFLWDWSVDYGRLESNSKIEISVEHFPGAVPGFPSFFNSSQSFSGDNAYSYVEPFINSDGVQAIRFYETEGILQNVPIDYTECSDGSGQPFGPSGSPNSAATAVPSPYIETPLLFTGTQEPKPVVVNRETGLEVNFETGIWDAQADFVDRTLTCTSYFYDEGINGYNTGFNGAGIFVSHYEPRVTGFSEVKGARVDLFEGRYFYGEWSVDGDQGPASQWYEPVTNSAGTEGVRYWIGGPSDIERSNRYQECYARDRNGPVSSRPNSINTATEVNEVDPVEVSADDTNIDEALPIANEDTLPVVTDNCDYTDAADFDGWGFDSITMTSCPPIDNGVSVNEMTDVANGAEGTGPVEVSDDLQTNPSPADNSPDESSGNSDDAATAAENEDSAVENDVVASGTQVGSTSVGLVSSDESTSQGGGGSFWLSVLIFLLALKRPMLSIQSRIDS